jgi:hypothetical protein
VILVALVGTGALPPGLATPAAAGIRQPGPDATGQLNPDGQPDLAAPLTGPGSLVPSSAEGNLPGGTSIEASLDALTAPSGGNQTLFGRAAIGEGTAAANTVLVYVLDVSGSTLSGSGCGGNQNGDGSSNTRLDCEIAAARALNQQAIASGIVAEVGVVGFAGGSATADLGPAAGSQPLTGPATDADGVGGPDVEEALRSAFTQSSGGSAGYNRFTRVTTPNSNTNFSAGITGACNLLASSAQPNRIVVFLSDGANNAGVNVATVLPCSPPATFHTFAAGPSINCAATPSQGGLQTIANLTGGTCTTVADLTTLPEILEGIVASRLVSASLTIDGGPPIDVTATATPALPVNGPASVELEIEIPALGPGVHELCLTAGGIDAGGAGSVRTCSLTAAARPTADAGDDQDVPEGSLVTLDATRSRASNVVTRTWTTSADFAEGGQINLTDPADSATCRSGESRCICATRLVE